MYYRKTDLICNAPLFLSLISENYETSHKVFFLFKKSEEMATTPSKSGDPNACIDHPLSDGPESAWRTFFKDNEVLLQIDRDVRRLCPDISFFQQVRSIIK